MLQLLVTPVHENKGISLEPEYNRKSELEPFFETETSEDVVDSPGFSAQIQFCCKVVLCFVVLFAVLFGVIYQLLLRGGKAGLAHLWSDEKTWEYLHSQKKNGVWNYGSTTGASVRIYVDQQHSSYSSLIDLSCSVGVYISEFEKHHPNAKHFGTDISSKMVKMTQKRCRSCKTSTFDLNKLRVSNEFRIDGFPQSFDVAIVADVLIYINWKNLPPFMANFLPNFVLQAEQQRFMNNLASLVNKEIVFSNHQNNPIVLNLFQNTGVKYVEEYGVYVLSGQAANQSVKN